jgi:hypothetical protein
MIENCMFFYTDIRGMGKIRYIILVDKYGCERMKE